METRLTVEQLLKGHNSGKNQLSMTSIKYDDLQVMGTITRKFHQNPLKTVGGVAEARLTAEKLLKGHNSSKNQSSMISIKYAHLQVMGTITRKFHQNPLKTVGGVAETRLCLRTDRLTDGRKDRRTDEPITILSFDLCRGTMN